MVRNRWIGLVVAIALLMAIAAPPLQAAQSRDGHRTAVVESGAGMLGPTSWLASWIGAAWNWFVAVFAEENGHVIPAPDPGP